jgi:CubicO group peptidase (beta-lactamase class C family)
MLRHIVLLFSLLFIQITAHAQIDEIIHREMQEREIPGLQIAAIHKGQIVFSKSYGFANLQDSILVDSKSVFAINSITKVFTAVAVMQLAEKGAIDLSAPVAKYLDDLPAEWSGVTLTHLLTHTSGLPDVLRLLDPKTGGFLDSKNEAEEWQKIKSLPVDFAAGERFSYNQTNSYLLGKLIDKYSGQPFAEDFNLNQFKKAGMPNTVFGDSRDVIPHFAPTYFWRKNIDGRPLDKAVLVNNYYEFPYFRRTASGLNSTAEDMAKWLIALQNGKLLQQKSLKRMWQPAAFNNGKPTPWVLGWGMNKLREKHRAVGMSGGGRSAFLLYPDDDLAVIVFTNLGGSYPEDFLEEIAAVYIPGIIKADAVTNLRINLRKTGFDKAIPYAEKEMKDNPSFKPNEFELNEWAYRMMAKGKNQEAKEIFRLNVHLFPESGNTYDSYGEVLLKLGEKNKAIDMYKKAVALDPGNEHGKNVLAKLLAD